MRVGVDSGGTFTDVVGVDAEGRVRTAKRPSTPRDPAQAVLAGVAAVAGAAARAVVHSTTVGTNALLERRGGPTALICTSGFEDVLVLGRQARPQLYALHPLLAPPLVDDAHRLGLDARMDAAGRELRAPSPTALDALRVAVAALGVRSVAVCLLHAHVDGAHERAVAAALAPLGLPVSLSSEVLPVEREYERTTTTLVDAYLQPVMAPYLARLAAAWPAAQVRVMESSGGARRAVELVRRPVRTVLSGPAAGVVGAHAVARAVGGTDAITFDMGGTSTDVALLDRDGAAEVDEGIVAGLPIQLPMLAVHTVGAGGGSIARLDEGGALKVGPLSAGADPGPAACGRGELPTVTDADLVLGRLHPAHFLGGAAILDPARAWAALAPLAAALDATPEAVAEAVIAVVDTAMARALRAVTVERGVDPRHFTLIAYGGAGPMHACAVARELELSRVLVPPSPGLLCAYGALVAPVRCDHVESLHLALPLDEPGQSALAARLARARAEVARRLGDEGVAPGAQTITAAWHARYRGQSFDLAVPVGGDAAALFHDAHRARYGHALPAQPVELATLRVRGSGPVAAVAAPSEPAEPGDPQVGRTALRWDGRTHDAPVLVRRRLAPGARLSGPALIVEYSATTLVPPGAAAEVLDGGALLIRW